MKWWEELKTRQKDVIKNIFAPLLLVLAISAIIYAVSRNKADDKETVKATAQDTTQETAQDTDKETPQDTTQETDKATDRRQAPIYSYVSNGLNAAPCDPSKRIESVAECSKALKELNIKNPRGEFVSQSASDPNIPSGCSTWSNHTTGTYWGYYNDDDSGKSNTSYDVICRK